MTSYYTYYCTVLYTVGSASLEYLALAFNQDNFLAAYSGVPDFKFDLWDWKTEELICSVPSEMTTSSMKLCFGPDIGFGPSKLLLVSAEEENEHRGLSVWKVKRCGQERRLVREPELNLEVKNLMRGENIMSATWQNKNILYVMKEDKKIFKVNVA